jgi:hypothetical protein
MQRREQGFAFRRHAVSVATVFFNDFEIYIAADRREAARVGYHKV